MDLQKLNERRAELFAEYDKGKKVLAELGQKTEQTTKSMLQIEGGLAVLDEIIAKTQAPAAAKPEEATEPDAPTQAE